MMCAESDVRNVATIAVNNSFSLSVKEMATCGIKQCSICQDDLKTARLLPCLHAFCLECLERYCRDGLPGDDARCPECRTDFQIPKNGVAGSRSTGVVRRRPSTALTALRNCASDAAFRTGR